MNTLMTTAHERVSPAAQRAVCIFFAALIVGCSLTLGAVGTDLAFEHAVAVHNG
jgi:hypothetical protein